MFVAQTPSTQAAVDEQRDAGVLARARRGLFRAAAHPVEAMDARRALPRVVLAPPRIRNDPLRRSQGEARRTGERPRHRRRLDRPRSLDLSRGEGDLSLDPLGTCSRVRRDNNHDVRFPDGTANRVIESASEAKLALVEPRLEAVSTQEPRDALGDRLVFTTVADENCGQWTLVGLSIPYRLAGTSCLKSQHRSRQRPSPLVLGGADHSIQSRVLPARDYTCAARVARAAELFRSRFEEIAI